MNMPEIQVLPTPAALAQEAANRVVESAKAAIELSGSFSLVLSGGSTPKALYELLADETHRTQIDWTKVRIFFGDERCVPPDDPQSNYRMVRETLLSKVPIPGDNVYRIGGEIDPNQAAIEYGQLLKEQFGDTGPDMILLGIGEDGHTASLFPQTEGLKELKHRCVANFVPRLNAWRVTMTARFINRAHQVMVMVTGKAKAGRVQEVLEGPRDPDRLPIQLIQPASGNLTWLLDAAAAGMGEQD